MCDAGSGDDTQDGSKITNQLKWGAHHIYSGVVINCYLEKDETISKLLGRTV